MSYLAAGAMFPLALAVAVCSWIYAPLYEGRVNAEKGAGRPSREELAAQWHALTAPRWIALACMAGLCALAVWSLWDAGCGWEELSRTAAALLALACATVFDARTHLIPNLLVGLMFLAGAAVEAAVFFLDRPAFLSGLLAAVGGMVICFAVFLLLSRLTKNGLGMGDVKLISAMAWLLGLPATLWSILFALLLCMVLAVFLMLVKKREKTELIPFGPFIFFGTIILTVFFRT